MSIHLSQVLHPHGFIECILIAPWTGVQDMATSFPSFLPGSNSTTLKYMTYCNTSLSDVVFGEWGDSRYAGSTSCGFACEAI